MGNGLSEQSKSTIYLTLTHLILGLEAHLKGAHLTVASVSYKTADLVKALSSLTEAILATAAAKAAWQAAVEEEDALNATVLPLVRGLRAILYAMYSNAPDVLVSFGMAQHKVPYESLAVKVAAAAKAAATRAREHAAVSAVAPASDASRRA